MTAIANTRSGKLEGAEEAGLFVFKGIPFAAPPIGVRRWMAPEPYAPWTGVRAAQAFGKAAPQNPPPAALTAAFPGMGPVEPWNEDCLYLNVWTPGLDRSRRPVMVWIHGGAFTMGSGSTPIYDGTTLARRGDVVIVTINYRLGPLGFLRLAELTNGKIPSTGNEGMLDQIAALKWVRDNIAEFGGDPDNVTIFGESAGGMSVGTLMGMPAARGLFHKAIPQSGSWVAKSVARASQAAEWLLRKAGASAADPDALRQIAPEALLKPMLGSALAVPELGSLPFVPVVDSEGVPRLSVESVADGAARGVATLIGTNLEEWKLFSAFDPVVLGLDAAGLTRRIGGPVGEAAGAIVETYRSERAGRGESVTPPELFMAMETDRIFRVPATRFAEAQGKHEPRVFNYIFTWKSPIAALGACHAIELGFVFGTHNLIAALAGRGSAADALAENTQDAWLAFARTGNPACDSLGDWPAYETARRATMMLGAKCEVALAPLEAERRAWDGIPNSRMGGADPS
ncbi:MAG: carboxylesterase/lipase family protein [Candidatus Binatales bacterium]